MTVESKLSGVFFVFFSKKGFRRAVNSVVLQAVNILTPVPVYCDLILYTSFK